MVPLMIISQDEVMRHILTLIGREYPVTLTTYTQPLEALRALETTVIPTVALFDIWREQWDDEDQARLIRYRAIPTRHACIVLWDAHIALPPKVRVELATQHVQVVKKPFELVLLDAALTEGVRQAEQLSAIYGALPPGDGPSASLG